MVVIVIIRRCVFWCVERKKFNCVGAGALIPSATGISVIQQFFAQALEMLLYEDPEKHGNPSSTGANCINMCNLYY